MNPHTHTTMKAVVKTAPGLGNTEIQNVAVPKPGPNDALVRMEAVSICGTDVHIYEWNDWAQKRIKTPLLYGHEFCGFVEEVGANVTHLKKGDRVSGECHIYCGHCFNCRTGNAHICENMKIFGVDTPGIFAQYQSLPAQNLLKNGDMPAKYYTIQDPLGNAVHTVFAADVPGRNVAVVGLGPIGLMAVSVCKAIGARKVIGIDYKNQYRMDIARSLGADLVASSTEPGLIERVKDLTEGHGVDAVLEMSGSTEALDLGIKMMRQGGTVAVLGIYNKPWTVDLNDALVFKYATFKGINGRLVMDTWYRMRGLIESKKLNLDPIITHTLKFDDFEKGMEAMRSGHSGKVVLYMD